MARKNEVKSAETVKPKENEPKKAVFEFKDSTTAEEYLGWKVAAPAELRGIVESIIQDKEVPPSQTGLRLTDQFLDTLGRSLVAKNLNDHDTTDLDPRVANLLKPLARVETQAGYINVFETLSNPDVSWNLKRRIYDTQIKTALEWLADRDLEELERKAQEKPATEQAAESTEPGEQDQSVEDKNDVPSANEDVVSSMEAGGENKEGEPTALFTVKPFFGGYAKQSVFNRFNPQTLKWEKPANLFSPAQHEAYDIIRARIMSGKVRGETPLALPLYDNWTIDIESLQTNAPDGTAEILQNQYGQYYLNVNSPGVFTYNLRMGPLIRIEEQKSFTEAEIIGDLPQELQGDLDILKKQRLPKAKLKREIVKLIRNHLVYSNSKEAWNYYTQIPPEFYKRIWQKKEADCHVSNTEAARSLFEVDQNVRFVSGYMIKGKNTKNEAVMHAGNGHAWLEVWDEIGQRAIRLDATPAGDPNIDQEQQERELNGETGEGDYGEEEIASEEQVKKQLEELKKKEGGGSKKKEKSGDSLLEQQFAELAECTPAQAREFLKALDRVREIKDKLGQPITELLMQEWRKIIEERKVESSDYHGPVRMDEGDRLEDPVSARIDIQSKQLNPTGFEKDEIVEKHRSDFGGLDIYFSFDLSGSMSQPDGASGRIKADVQRDVGLLFVDSLMQVAYMTRQYGQESDLLPIKIMVTLASDVGEVKLHLTDTWSPKEQWAFYTALKQLASGGTPTHTTLELIEKDFDKEQTDLKRQNVPSAKMPIHYTAEISDGGPNDFDATERMHQILKAKGMAIRSYTIGGQSASADAAPPLESFSQLPQILAKDIVEQFKKLRPGKIKI